MIRSLSIRGKMLAGFAAVIGLVGLGNLYGVLSVGQIAARTSFARDVAFRKVASLTEMESLVKRAADAAATAADLGIPEPLNQAKGLRGELDARVRSLTADSRDAGLVGDLQALGKSVDEHLGTAEKLMQLAAERQWSAFGGPRKEMEEGRSQLLQRAAAVKGRAEEELDGHLLGTSQLSKRTASTVAGATTLALVAALWTAVFLSGQIVRPLKRLLAMMHRAQQGDVSVRAVIESSDETGALSRGFNEMLEEIEGHRLRLEELVDERTAELESTNGRLQTELEIRQITEASLAESEELVRNVLGGVQAGILIVDADRHEVLEVNAYALARIGARRQDVVGQKLERYLAGGGAEAPAANTRAELRRTDGGTVSILRSAVPITHQGRAHLIVSFIDVSQGDG